MGDLVFLALVAAFFALATAYVAGCERIVGRAPVTDLSTGAEAAGAEAVGAGTEPDEVTR